MYMNNIHKLQILVNTQIPKLKINQSRNKRYYN